MRQNVSFFIDSVCCTSDYAEEREKVVDDSPGGGVV